MINHKRFWIPSINVLPDAHCNHQSKLTDEKHNANHPKISSCCYWWIKSTPPTIKNPAAAVERVNNSSSPNPAVTLSNHLHQNNSCSIQIQLDTTNFHHFPRIRWSQCRFFSQLWWSVRLWTIMHPLEWSVPMPILYGRPYEQTI